MYSSLGSLDKSASFMGEREVWKLIRGILKGKGIRVPHLPPAEHHLRYLREKFLNDVDYHSTTFTNFSTNHAIQYGAFNTSCSVLNKADSMFTIIGDGKVIKSPITSKTFNKLRQEESNKSLLEKLNAGYFYQSGEPSKKKITNLKTLLEKIAKRENLPISDIILKEEDYQENGSYRVFGSKWVILSVRLANKPNFRLILSVRPQEKGDDINQTYPGEAGVALNNILEIQELTNGGINFVTYDGAMRGKHCKKVMDHGIILITPVNGHTKFKAVIKNTCNKCGVGYQIFSSNGGLVFKQILDTGETYYEPIDYTLKKRKDKLTYRFYALLKLECGHTTYLKLNDAKDSSLLESFKPFKGMKTKPGTKPIYDTFRGFRQDAESFNRQVENKQAVRQTVGYSRNSQYLNMLAHMILNNAKCAYLYEPL